MKTIAKLLLFSISPFLFPILASQGNAAQAAGSVLKAERITEADVIGTWSYGSNLGTAEYTYRNDHTYTERIRGLAQGKVSGTWRLDGGKLIRIPAAGDLRVAGSKVPPEEAREEAREKLIELRGSLLTTEVPGRFIEYHRGPFDPNFNPDTPESANDLTKASADSTRLMLERLPLSAYAALAKFKDLDFARFDGPQGDGADDARLSAFAKIGFPALRSVTLANCPDVTDAGIIELATLPALESLILSKTGVGDKGCETLAAHPHLRSVLLEECPNVTAHGITALVRSSSLQRIAFSSRGLTEAQVLHILTESRQLKKCYIHDANGGLQPAAILNAGRAKGIKVEVYAKSGMLGISDPE